jgi:hypothetical protein
MIVSVDTPMALFAMRVPMNAERAMSDYSGVSVKRKRAPDVD